MAQDIDAGSSGINPNLLINGSLMIWQRGTSFAAPQNAYTADRMKCSGSGTVSRATANGGMKITDSMNVRYIMEDADYSQISSKTVTLSYSKNGTVVYQTFTAESSTVVDLNLADCTIEWLKLELGNKATPFVLRPIVEESALCQRYYVIYKPNHEYGNYGNFVVSSSTATITNGTIQVFLPSTMRTTPAIIKTGNMVVQAIDGNLHSVSSISSPIHTSGSVRLYITTETPMARGNALLMNSNDVNGSIAFDAEL